MTFIDYGRGFTSDKLGAIMSKLASPVLGWSMTLSCHRQNGTAWRRKLCDGSVENVSDDVAHAVQALQGGHSRGTDQNLYGRSPDAVLRISEDLIFLFLEASVEWQKIVRVVPGGLRLPYLEACRSQFNWLERKGLIKMGGKVTHKQFGDILNRVLQVQEVILARITARRFSYPAEDPCQNQNHNQRTPIQTSHG
jgi:hypothetical protein